VDERRRRESEQPPAGDDETLRTAPEPGQRLEGERDEPGQKPRADRSTDRIEAADGEPRRRPEDRCRDCAGDRARLPRQGRLAKQVCGSDAARGDEGALRE
jgi:hypothetical protein